MQRVLSIFFLAVFLFNIGAYSVVFWMLEQKASRELTVKIEQGVYPDGAELVVKMPLTIPYQTTRDYEPIDGEFEYQGEYYKLVKQRVFEDTLYVVCIRDASQKHLAGELTKFTKLTTEQSPSQGAQVVSNPLQEYTPDSQLVLTCTSSGWSIETSWEEPALKHHSTSRTITSPPPRA